MVSMPVWVLHEGGGDCEKNEGGKKQEKNGSDSGTTSKSLQRHCPGNGRISKSSLEQIWSYIQQNRHHVSISQTSKQICTVHLPSH